MLISVPDFNLEATLDSGQVFGFRKITEGTFQGILAGHSVQVSQVGDQLWLSGDQEALQEKRVRKYFDLDRDLGPLYELMGQENLRETGARFKGLRIIQQDGWEALACFIISANNNIKRIQKIWKSLSCHFCGSENSFPQAKRIAKSTEKTLRELGLGYRAPFLLDTAKSVIEDPKYLDRIRRADYETAKELVMRYPGVGPKVADCVLLFGFQKHESFPVDTWILRIMRKLYFRNRKVSENKIAVFARKRWGPWAGYLQQYLFQSARISILRK